PSVAAAPPKQCEQNGNEDDARARDEGGIGGRRSQQANRLEDVAAEHQRADLHSCPKFIPREGAKSAAMDRRHNQGRERKTQGHENKNGSIREGAFHDDERCSPEDRAERESEIGLEAAGSWN